MIVRAWQYDNRRAPRRTRVSTVSRRDARSETLCRGGGTGLQEPVHWDGGWGGIQGQRAFGPAWFSSRPPLTPPGPHHAPDHPEADVVRAIARSAFSQFADRHAWEKLL